MTRLPVIFLNSHPIQYFAPLYQQIHAQGIPLTVWYCSDESIQGKMDKGFGTEVKWDIPLLQGYRSVFLKNRSWKPSIHKGFLGLFNPGIIPFLYKLPKSVIIIHGWAYSTNIMAILFGRMFGHQVCLRAETPLNQELKKNKTLTFFKHLYLRFLFLFINRFLYIGEQNKLFYQALGVPEKKMLFTPYAVDNKRFQMIYETTDKTETRKKLNLPLHSKVIIYSGKYISKKRPFDLLKAFNGLIKDDALLVMAGDGELRNDMEAYIEQHDISSRVILTGFINQSLIPLYYRAADVFVMSSGLGETWGLSVNEAMNFGLPVIVSDTCGSSFDLVDNNITGAVFETGNVTQLSQLLQKFLDLTEKDKLNMSRMAIKKIDGYSYNHIIAAIETIR